MSDDRSETRSIRPILAQYDAAIKRITPLSPGRYWVETRDGLVRDGRVVSEQAAGNRCIAGDCAAGHGVRRVQRFIMNRYHERWVHLDDDHVFYLANAWHARPMGLSLDDVSAVGRHLARLHVALSGCGERFVELPFRYGTWAGAMKRGLTAFSSGTKPAPEAAPLWLDWVERWTELADESVQAVEMCGYQELAERARRKREVAWNHCRAENLLIVGDGSAAVMQQGDPVLDQSIYDLAAVARELCARGWTDGVKALVKAYAQVRPLLPAETQLIFAFAAYPHHAVQWLVEADRPEGMPADWERRAKLHYESAQALVRR